MLMVKYKPSKNIVLIALLGISIGLLSGNSYATEKPTKILETVFENEEAIVFSTKGGQTTDAYQGFFEVPENRKNPNSRTIKIQYVRFPATKTDARSPIVYLSGGPGGSGINTAKVANFRFPLFMAMREFGDVIALDQRGTGISNDTTDCRSSQYISLNQIQTEESVIESYKKAALECVNFWQENKVDIKGYTTIQNAFDLDDLRKHLGAEKLSLWGISYGSHLALTALKLMDKHIDKVVIASAEGLNQTVKLPYRTDDYFKRLQSAVNSQLDTPMDLIGLIRRVHDKLDKKPIQVKIANQDGSFTDMLFQKIHLQRTASGMIADPHRGVPYLLALYQTLLSDDLSVLNQVLKMGYFRNEPITLRAMPFAMDVASGITEERLALVNEQAKDSLFGLALNFPMPHLNKVLQGLDLGDNFRAKPKSNVPTLLLTGTLDGRTYPQSQKEAVSGLSALTHVTIENAGHNLFMSSPKVTEAILAFMSEQNIEVKQITIDLPNFNIASVK